MSSFRRNRHRDTSYFPELSSFEPPVNKTRRIDPDRLAAKLDPGLVREMDACIIPGAVMPSYEFRKDLQQRYKVDRRVLYDYLHSRGLRVSKEDKHNNLTRNRALQIERRKYMTSPAQTFTTSSPPARPRRSLSPKRPAQPPKFLRILSEKSTNTSPRATAFFTSEDHIETVHSNFLLPALVPRSPVIAIEPSLFPSSPREDAGPDYHPLHSSPLTWTPRPTTSLNLLNFDTLPTFEQSTPNYTPLTAPLQKEMSLDESREWYNLISDVIGPPIGIQESAGTYQAYMHLRSRDYLQRILDPATSSEAQISPSAPLNGHPLEFSYSAAFSTSYRSVPSDSVIQTHFDSIPRMIGGPHLLNAPVASGEDCVQISPLLHTSSPTDTVSFHHM